MARDSGLARLVLASALLGLALPAAGQVTEPVGGQVSGQGAGQTTNAGATPAAGLADALRATLTHHPAVGGQRAQVEASRFAADAARSQRYPTITAQIQQYSEQDREARSGEDLSNPASLRVRQPLWAFGRISDRIDVAEAGIRTASAELLVVRRRLTEDTALAYAEVRSSVARIRIARRNVAQLKALRAQIGRRVAGQLASRADERLAATRLAQARAQLNRFIGERAIARNELLALTQVPVSAGPPIAESLLNRALLASPTGRLVDAALAHSAEIRVKKRQLVQASTAVGRARSSAMPTLYLQAEQLYDQPDFRDDSRLSLVLEASLDGLGFAAAGRTGEARARRTAAKKDLAATRVEVTRRVQRLQRGRRLQTTLIASHKGSLVDLEALLESYRRQYEAGAKSWLEVLNMQRELSDQRLRLVQARAQWRMYSLQLLATTGGLDALAGIEESGNNDHA